MKSKFFKDKIVIKYRVLSVLVVILVILFIINWYFDNELNKNLISEVTRKAYNQDTREKPVIKEETDENDDLENNEKTDNSTDIIKNNSSIVNFEYLKSKNPSTVGWIKVNGTNIDYPVVQYKDNKYYLTHTFDGSYNSAGWIFADYRYSFDGSSKNLTLYGHNRRDGSMFNTLKKTLTSEWYSNIDNYVITFATPEATKKYKVFSVYQVKAETYYTTANFDTEKDYEEFLFTIASRSIHNFNIAVSKSDEILTLSTCASNNEYRVVLHAKRIDG